MTITDIELSEIRQRITETIKEGVDDEYLDIVKALEDSFYAEDIAAAAIMLYAEQGGRREVRRRTLNKAPFVPLRTKETLARSQKKLPAVRSPSRPVVQETRRGASPGPAAQNARRRTPPRQGAPKNAGGRPQGFKGQKGRGAPQGKRR
ncbi:MAG: hypothetical protein A4E28_00934 [Methanocella sp. PtaU1.Bin125]|nr:MAG: hypothetical protein A4E28_00934 [Methanocella sp. PtaU1.Bin125]